MMLRTERRRRRFLWVAGVAAATTLFLGVSGTLAGWTQAVIAVSTNTTSTGAGLILSATQGGNTCSTGTDPSNSISCTTINHYSGPGVLLLPAAEKNYDVTFKNTGLANATTFTLTPGSCARSGPGSLNLCTAGGNLQVQIKCSPGATYNAGTAWSDLSYAYAVAPTAVKSHTAAGGDLNAGAQWTCRTSVKLLVGADTKAQGVTVTQPFTWKLAK